MTTTKFEIIEPPTPAPSWPSLERQYPGGAWGEIPAPHHVEILHTALGLPWGAAAAVLRAGGRVSGPRTRIPYAEGHRNLIHSLLVLPGVSWAQISSTTVAAASVRGVVPTLEGLEAAYLRQMTSIPGAVAIEADPEARAKTLALRQRVALLEERLEALAQIEALRARVRALDAQIAALPPLPQVEV